MPDHTPKSLADEFIRSYDRIMNECNEQLRASAEQRQREAMLFWLKVFVFCVVGLAITIAVAMR